MSAGALAETSRWKVAPFPKAEKGMKRQVIQLPQQQDESALKVELMTARRWKSTATIIVSAGELEVKPGRLGL